jgi:uncharacterized RDD family membrane protein YckC
MMPASPTGARIPARLRVRLAAAIYDLLPLVGLWFATAAAVLLALHGNVDVVHPSPIHRASLRISLIAVTAAYFVASWVRGGQTIGMRAWRLRVVAAEGGALPWPRALARFAVSIRSLAALGLGYAWCLVDAKRRTWHDLASRSAVVVVPRAEG